MKMVTTNKFILKESIINHGVSLKYDNDKNGIMCLLFILTCKIFAT